MESSSFNPCDGLMALSNQEPRKKNPFIPSSSSQIDVNCELADPVQGCEKCLWACLNVFSAPSQYLRLGFSCDAIA